MKACRVLDTALVRGASLSIFEDTQAWRTAVCKREPRTRMQKLIAIRILDGQIKRLELVEEGADLQLALEDYRLKSVNTFHGDAGTGRTSTVDKSGFSDQDF